jgi:hypothetical protein
MVTIGVDPHKDTHSAVAVDVFGRQIADRTAPAVRDGLGDMLAWGRGLGDQRTWVIEDCRHVSGPFERFLLDHGETVVRLPPHLMACARRGVREARQVRSDRRPRGRASRSPGRTREAADRTPGRAGTRTAAIELASPAPRSPTHRADQRPALAPA